MILNQLRKAIREFGLIYLNEISPEDLYKQGKVFLNGNLIGIHPENSYLVRVLKLGEMPI